MRQNFDVFAQTNVQKGPSCGAAFASNGQTVLWVRSSVANRTTGLGALGRIDSYGAKSDPQVCKTAFHSTD
jgi:hypothetical protein